MAVDFDCAKCYRVKTEINPHQVGTYKYLCKICASKPKQEPIIQFHKWPTGFWLRLFGRGIYISSDKPLFSERNGYVKVLRIGKWRIKYLEKWK